MKIYFRDELTGYDIDKGWTYIKNANETLDSAVIRISHLTTKLDIQPFDNVRIEGDNGNPILNFASSPVSNLYLCIDSYQEQQVSLDPIIYNYEINLFSEVKKLENVILPNISITPKKLSRQLTIQEFIEQIWELYCPKERVNNVLQNKYSLPIVWYDGFLNVCPEKQWTTPTLRDVMNDLAMICDCIPIMKNNHVDFLDLTTQKTAITSYNYITRSRNSQDYATDLKMNLQNILSKNCFSKTFPFQTFVTTEYIMTSDNLMLETQFPILNIKHLWINWIAKKDWDSDINDSTCVYMRADLCNLRLYNDSVNYSIVKEKKLYDVLPVMKMITNDFVYDSAYTWANCKNTCLYFTRGDNRIFGFSTVNKVTILQSQQLLQEIVHLAELDWLNRKYSTQGNIPTLTSSYNAFNDNSIIAWSFPTFEIEYETTKEVVFSASKQELLRNERTIMDNQTNAWVNSEAQGQLEYQKANRIGNEVAMINQRITDGNPADIFQHLGNEIIYRTEYQIFDNYVDVNAYATKDYILRDYFTGVNSKIRTWVNARDEAFIRHDLYKYYIEFDTVSYYDVVIGTATDYNSTINIDKVLSPLYRNLEDDPIQPINYCLVKCDNYPASDKYFVLGVIKRVIGNSIIITWGFNDNYIALKTFNFGTHTDSDALEDDGNVFRTDFANRGIFGTETASGYLPAALNNHLGSLGGVPLQAFEYCDKDGNFEDLEVNFLSQIDELVGDGEEHTKFTYWDNITLPISANKNNESPVFDLNAKVYKDNKEIITGSLQLEYISNNRNIFIYDNMVILNKLIYESNAGALQLYTSDSSVSIPPTPITSGLYTITTTKINDYSISVDITFTSESIKKRYLWVCAGSNPLVRLDTIKSFKVNLLRKRNKTGF